MLERLQKKKEFSYTVGGMQIGTALWEQYGGSFLVPYKLKQSYHVIEQSHYREYIQGKIQFKRIHASQYSWQCCFMVSKIWKQLKHPWADEQKKKMCYLYTREYYSAIRKNKMTLASTSMDLEIIILSEVSQTKEDYI